MARFDKNRPLQPKGAVPFREKDPNTERNVQDIMRQIRELQNTTPEIASADYLWVDNGDGTFGLKITWFANRTTYSMRLSGSYWVGGVEQTISATYTKDGSPFTFPTAFTGYEEDFTLTLVPFSKVEVEDTTGQPLSEPDPGVVDDRQKQLQFDGALDVVVDIDPRLDEDSGTLYLYPNRSDATLSVRWVVRTDGPPTAEQTALGTVSTADQIAIYSFGGAVETVYVGVIPYDSPDGTSGRGSHRVIPYSYSPGNDVPVISWLPATPTAAGNEAVRLLLTDDGDNVALYYRTYTVGATPPAYTRVPAAGFQADPLVQDIEVAKPAEGAANVAIEAYGVDEEGNQTARNLYLEIDGNSIPSGDFKIRVGTDGAVYVTPVVMDTDTGSYRFRASLSAFTDPIWSDAASDEFEGNTYGSEVSLGSSFNVLGGRTVYISGYFLRTTSTAAGDQNSSLRSPNVRVAATGGKGAGYQVQPLVNSDGEVTVHITALSDLSFVYATSTTAFPAAPTSAAVNLTSGQYTLDPAITLTPGQTFYISVWFYSGLGGTGVQSDRITGQVTFTSGALPYFAVPKWGPGIGLADFSVFINDPLQQTMSVHVWSNKAGTTTPDPNSAAVDGTFTGKTTGTQLTAATLASNGTQPLNDIAYAYDQEKMIYLEIVTSDGRSSGKQGFKVEHKWDTIDPTGRIRNAASFAAGIEPITVVSSVPGTKSTEQIFNTADSKLYKWNGTAYTAKITGFSDLNGTIAASQILADTINGNHIDANSIDAGHINGAIITTSHLDGESAVLDFLWVNGYLEAEHIHADTLDAFSADLGEITAGVLRNNADTSAILLDAIVPGVNIDRYMDLGGAAAYFLYADGDFTVSHTGVLTATGASIEGSLTVNDSSGQEIFFTQSGTTRAAINQFNNQLFFQISGTTRLSIDSGGINVTGDIEVPLGNSIYIGSWQLFEDSGSFKIYDTNTFSFHTNGWADAVTWNSVSDDRLKSNKRPVVGALAKVKQLSGYTYDPSAEGRRWGLDRTQIGLIAQDVQKVLPEAVSQVHDSEYLGVAYGAIVPLLVEAIKELDRELQSVRGLLSARL